MKSLSLAVALAVSGAFPANAITLDIWCSDFRGYSFGSNKKLERPKPPSCIDMLGISRDSFSFDMCRNDVERYRNKMRNYLRCLDEEGSGAIEDVNKAVDRFNCYASGQDVCF